MSTLTCTARLLPFILYPYGGEAVSALTWNKTMIVFAGGMKGGGQHGQVNGFDARDVNDTGVGKNWSESLQYQGNYLIPASFDDKVRRLFLA